MQHYAKKKTKKKTRAGSMSDCNFRFLSINPNFHALAKNNAVHKVPTDAQCKQKARPGDRTTAQNHSEDAIFSAPLRVA